MLQSGSSADGNLCGLSSNIDCVSNKVAKPKGYLTKAIDAKDIIKEHIKEQKKDIKEKGPSDQQALKALINTVYRKSLNKRRKLDQLGGAAMKKRRTQTKKRRVIKRGRPLKKRSVTKKRLKRTVGRPKRKPRRQNKNRF